MLSINSALALATWDIREAIKIKKTAERVKIASFTLPLPPSTESMAATIQLLPF